MFVHKAFALFAVRSHAIVGHFWEFCKVGKKKKKFNLKLSSQMQVTFWGYVQNVTLCKDGFISCDFKQNVFIYSKVSYWIYSKMLLYFMFSLFFACFGDNIILNDRFF